MDAEESPRDQPVSPMAAEEAPRIVHVDPTPPRFPLVTNLVRLLRVHQWVKNLLVFTPVLAAHAMRDPRSVRAAILAFVAFSLCASGIYIVNDIYDLEADRHHSQKRRRPLAAGDVSVPVAVVVAVPLVATGAAMSWALSPQVFRLIGFYVTLSLAYSYVLKELALVDVLTLAGLYTLRVLVGGAAARIELSPWLLAFSMFLFISLAIVKRVSELRDVRDKRQEGMRRRGYSAADLEVLSIVGVAAGQMAVLVLALYIQSENVVHLYRRPDVLWLLCVVMFYWIARVWLKLYRGEMNQDPVVYALRDGGSYAAGLSALVIAYIASR